MNLREGNTITDLWGFGLADWFRTQSAKVFGQPKPVVVVTPSPATAQAIKAFLLKDNIPVMGIEFWRPADLRRFLAAANGWKLPVDDPRLIAAGVRSVAGEIAAGEPSNATAQAVSRSAQALADTIIMLEAAGWTHAEIKAEPLRLVAERFFANVSALNAETVGRFDFRLLSNAKGKAPVLASILIAGFDGAHWEHWPVLAAAATLAQDVFVTLPIAHEAAGAADMIWCSSWEQLGGSESAPPASVDLANERLSKLADHLDLRSRGALPEATGDTEAVRFIAAENLTEEARLVALQAASLVSGGADSVGVLVPNAGPLAREITLALERLGVEHYTTLPGYSSPVPHAGSWPAVLDALATGTADALCTFLRSNGGLPASFTQDIGAIRLADTLESLADVTLVSDIPVIRALLDRSDGDDGDTREQALKHFLSLWPNLPLTGSFGGYLTAIQSLMAALGWHELALSVADAKREQASAQHMVLSLEAACEWLRVAVPSRRVHRTACNGNPYAKVQVMIPTDAVWKTWDHLIFAGQTEGVWPPPLKPAGYLGEEAVRSLNHQAGQLNQAGTMTGIFGEGMTVVREGKGYCVGPLDQRAMHVRDLVRLVNATKGSVIFSAAIADETDGGRAFHPGDFYRRVFSAVHGETIDADGLHRIMQESTGPTWLALPKADKTDTASVRKAWDARNHGTTLSEYEFTLGGSPCRFPVTISPSNWGIAFSAPAEVFLQAYLGVRAPRDTRGLPLRSAMGIWAHRFVELAARNAGADEDWAELAIAASDDHLSEMRAALATQGRTIPSWWLSCLAQARSKAVGFSRVAGEQSKGFQPLVERRIPDGSVKLNSGNSLSYGGRFDLLLSDIHPLPNLSFHGGNQKLLDFKTGSDKPLKGAKSLARFEGLQLALYILGLKQRGAGRVEAALVTDGEPWSAQLTDDDIETPEAMEVFERMAKMQANGLFGWTGIVRDTYSQGCAYPMATVAPVVNIAAKFNNTHFLNN